MTIFDQVEPLPITPRIARLKARLFARERRVSLDQARLVTEAYRQHPDESRARQRALAFAHVADHIPLAVDPDELIVGNRSPGIRDGIVFPEAAVAWIDRELATLPTRPQDPFAVSAADIVEFRERILPFWRGRTLEDCVYGLCGAEMNALAKVVKINQRDHAQGHIIPNVATWLAHGPAGLAAAARSRADGREFYDNVGIVLAAASRLIARYADIAPTPSIAERCRRLATGVPVSFHDAVQSVWFLFVLLHLESNASSFSLGRLDRYLEPYLEADLAAGRLDVAGGLEILEAFWIKCNEIVYLRNAHSAQYFAGFPIGFNICIGGDTPNRLSYLCLKAQADLGLPQPNLSARLAAGTPREFLEACARVIGRGSGMPQLFNDDRIIPALAGQGIAVADARDYGVVGCVELSTQGNLLGWSDAAMFNLVKALELALHHGRCLLTGDQLGPDLGGLDTYQSYAEVETALAGQIRHFVERMLRVCPRVEQAHVKMMPTAFLSAVVDDCLERGVDVTAGGARYNLSGIQAIQAANLADSLAVLKGCYGPLPSVAATSLATSTTPATEGGVPAINRFELFAALRANWAGHEPLRQRVLEEVPKYGNDVAWVDELAARWTQFFADQLAGAKNYRGGSYHMGLYTVSAHVPMGQNVGASPDGRRAREPLADGGISPMAGRDRRGPTAVLQSVARLPLGAASNGALLNMKFLPQLFASREGVTKFAALLAGWQRLGITHAQFNVVRREDLLAAKREPEKWRHLTIRVAGYTAYFVELAPDLQDEIIARTVFGEEG